MNPSLFILYGPSGTGKSTLLRYLETNFNVETAPKYTNRPNRFTVDDSRDFIFLEPSGFPKELLLFKSYDYFFGIQLNEIENSFNRGNSHSVIVGNCEVVNNLINIYGKRAISIFVYCDILVLKERIFRDPSHHRIERWPMISEEISNIYRQLESARFVVNNSGNEEDTFNQIKDIISRI